jgi:DNA-binding transcriptional regulator YdaS (Cro superfamily)
MNKIDAIQKAGGAKQLAQLLGITQPAISQWGDQVPKMRVFQLRALKPEWFQ